MIAESWNDSTEDREECPADAFSLFRGGADDDSENNGKPAEIPVPKNLRNGKSGEAEPAERYIEPRLVCLENVETRRVDWLWRDRIPLGKYSMLAGDPGCGKSLIVTDIAARTSNGCVWPDGSQNRPGGVVMLSAEDDVEDTICPRLIAAGADLSRIRVLESVSLHDPEKPGRRYERSVNLLTDLPAIERAVQQTPDCRLVTIDPISAYSGSADSHKNADVRGMLAPLCALAAKMGFAILGVTHLNKSNGTSALYRATGSLAYVAAARAVWLVTKDRDDPTGKRRLMLPAKCNLSEDNSGLAYGILNPPRSDLPVIGWEARPVRISADAALEPAKPQRQSKTDAAVDWLTARLANGEQVASDTLEAEAAAAGIKGGTYRRARQDAGVLTSKGTDGKWYVSLA